MMPEWLDRKIEDEDIRGLSYRCFTGLPAGIENGPGEIPEYLSSLSCRALSFVSRSIKHASVVNPGECITWRLVTTSVDRDMAWMWKNVGPKTIDEVSNHFEKHGVEWLTRPKKKREQNKLHLEYLRCAIADWANAEVEGLREDMDSLWAQMDETSRDIVKRDVAPLVDSTNMSQGIVAGIDPLDYFASRALQLVLPLESMHDTEVIARECYNIAEGFLTERRRRRSGK